MRVSKMKCMAAAGILLLLSSVYAQEAVSGPESQTQSQIQESQILLDAAGDQAEAEASAGASVSGVWIFLRMILVLGIVIAALYLLFRFMKKSIDPEMEGSDEVFLRKVSAVGIGAGKSVQIVSLWNKAYVLGVSDSSVSLLETIDDKDLVDAMNRYADMNSAKPKPKTFEEILELFMPGQKARSSAKSGKKPGKSAYDESTMNLIQSLKEKRVSDGEKT
ncbi:MAG: flagellar biosynthetic protein FliO [Treponema sp.]|nr:flagellar biosynthetic protein FliO [Treponema sp.]